MITVPEKQAVCRRPDGTFAAGCSGNPGGKKPGVVSLRRLLEAALEAPVDSETRHLVPDYCKTNGQALAYGLVRDAIAGQAAARKLLLEYTTVRPLREMDVSATSVTIVDNIPRFSGDEMSDMIARYDAGEEPRTPDEAREWFIFKKYLHVCRDLVEELSERDRLCAGAPPADAVLDG